MKYIKYTLLALATLLFGTAYAQDLVEEDLSHLGSFDKIEASVGWEVTYTESNTTSIQVAYSQKVADLVRIEVKGGRLILALKNKDHSGQKKPKNIKLIATVSSPSLSAVSASTGAEVSFASPVTTTGHFSISATTGADVEELVLNARELKCSVTTGADVEAQVVVNRLSASSTTGSDLSLSGKAQYAKLSCTTGAEIEAKNLTVEDGHCRATTGGEIIVTILNKADAKTTTSGDITIYGNPKVIVPHNRGVRFR